MGRVLEKRVRELLTRARNPSKIREEEKREKIKIYATGLTSKIAQAELALKEIENLYNYVKPATGEERSGDAFDFPGKMHFYTDSFWVFLRATLDVLAQIINQTENINRNEADMYFHKVIDYYNNRQRRGSNIAVSLQKIVKSRAYVAMRDYRNCALHRRRVFIKGRLTETYTPPEYGNTTGGLEMPVWFLCDNPLIINPTVRYERELKEYCTRTLEKTEKMVSTVIYHLLR